jgi:hypothetical protein
MALLAMQVTQHAVVYALSTMLYNELTVICLNTRCKMLHRDNGTHVVLALRCYARKHTHYTVLLLSFSQRVVVKPVHLFGSRSFPISISKSSCNAGGLWTF